MALAIGHPSSCSSKVGIRLQLIVRKTEMELRSDALFRAECTLFGLFSDCGKRIGNNGDKQVEKPEVENDDTTDEV